MINLLTPEAQAKLLQQYRHRRRVVAGTLAITCFAAAILLCVVLAMQLHLETSGLTQQLEKSQTSSSGSALKQELSRTAAEIKLLQSRGTQQSLIAAREAINKLAVGVKIHSWHWSLAEGGKSATLQLEGQASTRETLIAFVNALKKEKIFKTVESPVTNLIKSQNPALSLKLTLSPQ